MNCLSFKANIDPKWKHAIDNNVCPFCGEPIMPEDLKEHISNLHATLTAFQENYPEQLDDWLLSNFNYVRTDGEKIKDFFPKQKVVYRKSQLDSDDGVEVDDDLVDVQDPEVTSKFFKNAGVSGTVKRTGELKKMISQIKSDNPSIHNVPVNYDNDGLEDTLEMDDSYSEQIPASVLAFANKRGSNDPSDYNAKDLIRMQNMHEKIREARQNVVNGTGGKGSFSRG